MIIKTLDNWYTRKKVTETTTLVGNKNYGKSYASMKIAEICAKNNWPFGIIDKMGIHYVLRNVFDNVVIIGGDHGDFDTDRIDNVMPVILENNLSFILDVSDLDDIFAQEFVGEVFEYLYYWHKEHRKPRNYIIEESDAYIGQNGVLSETKKIITKCITKGRMYGFGFTLISQRYRMLEKTALAQTDNYVIFNMKLPIDLNLLKALTGENLNTKVRRLKQGMCIIMSDEGHATYSIGTKESPSVSMTPEIGVEIKDVEIKKLNEEVLNKFIKG